MKVTHLLKVVVLLFVHSVRAQNTPLDQAIPEGIPTPITCENTQAPRLSDAPVFKSAKEADEAKGTYHYKVWLPNGYNADASKRWPCMFISSPGGNANMGKIQGYLQANSFIVVMLVEAKNGPWGPIVGNFLAAHDDAIKRFRIQEGKKYATGLSGGARASSLYVQLRPGFGGVILQGAGAAYDLQNNYAVAELKRNHALPVAMIMGKSDGNKVEIPRMQKVLPAQRFSLFEFEGGHEWAPSESFEKAMDWINTKQKSPGTGAGSSSFPGSSSPFKSQPVFTH